MVPKRYNLVLMLMFVFGLLLTEEVSAKLKGNEMNFQISISNWSHFAQNALNYLQLANFDDETRCAYGTMTLSIRSASLG